MTLFSIGHSNARLDAFLELLRRYEIAVLVDTRSSPYSRYNPQFNRESLEDALQQQGIAYAYLGDQIGGRPESEAFYFGNGRVDYESLATAPFYLAGIARMLELAAARPLAFMCAEGDYKKCHRYWLITRTLLEREIEVKHILHSGETIASRAREFEPEQPSLF
jgi:uncharacterized protein (DUF488 family)